MRIPPKMNKGVIFSPRKNQPRRVPTTGWAKNVSDAAVAGNCAKAKFHRNIATAVEIMPRKRIPPITP